ncbi:MAG: beta-lactamase family protein [Ignavibacteriae bacterium]|nr:beta-lactamase family protein [Ignavibacteriota bacterium]
MKTKKLTTLIIILLLTSCSNHIVEKDMSIAEKVKYYLNDLIKDSDTPGVQYIILDKDSTIFEFYGGKSDIAKRAPFTATTTINAFSVTKTFTALAILQLEENNKLNIDDYVQTYLDYLPYKTKFSIRQVLNHTSGLPNPMPLEWAHLLDEKESFNYQEFIKNVLDENDELDNNPGEEYSYSNIGYLILGEIISKVSGEDYRTYINNNIIQKLSLSNDAYLGFVIPDTLNHAHGYIKKWSWLNIGLNFVFDKSKYMEDTYDGWTQFKYFYMNGYPFGGLIGNARGFAKYLQVLLLDDMLINNEKKLKLFENRKTKNGDKSDMCLGWFKGVLDGEIYYTHAGGGGGYYCEIRLYPQKKMASVIMFNRTGVSDERFLDSIDKFFF